MKRGSKKSPFQQEPKSKEQLEREIEVARKRKIVVEQFYPALKEATISVEEAKILLQSISGLIMNEVMETMRERRFEDIYKRVVEKLTPDDMRVLQVEALLNTVKGETLFVAREIIEGMSRAIAQMEIDDNRTRKLDALKADWSRYLN